MVDRPFADKFGFTEAEVVHLLKTQHLDEAVGVAGDWYTGYQIGGVVIYNPWSVLSFAADGALEPKPYWINTSANTLIRDHVIKTSSSVQARLETLLQGGSIKAHISRHLSFREIEHDQDALWDLLLFSGYLKEQQRSPDPEDPYQILMLPNREVTLFFRTLLQTWLRAQVGKDQIEDLTNGLDVTDLCKSKPPDTQMPNHGTQSPKAGAVHTKTMAKAARKW